MIKIIYAGRFLRDFKKCSKSGINFKERLNEAIGFLGSGVSLPEKFKDHKLTGKWNGYRECHIRFDLLLVYRCYEKNVELITLGAHSELF